MDDNKRIKKNTRKNKIGLIEVKAALNDGRFRELLPPELDGGVAKFLKNPTCPCNVPIYRKVLNDCKEQLEKYYPGREIVDDQKDILRLVYCGILANYHAMSIIQMNIDVCVGN